ncbi:MAG TPA: hypothetical protein VKZ18_13345 [Polyangia bacterium]|nr:hypothetical protein [Polyangia bacterium]
MLVEGGRRRVVMARAGAVLALAGGALGAWLYEVVQVRGWEGLRWLSAFPRAGLAGSVLVPLAMLAVLVEPGRPSARRALAFLAVSTAVCLAAFALGRAGVYALFEPGHLPPAGRAPAFEAMELTLLALVGAAVGLWASVRALLRPLTRWAVAYLALAIVLVLPASVATIRLVPALNGSQDFVHAVKMGYPVFWTVVLVAAAVAVAVKRTPQGS